MISYIQILVMVVSLILSIAASVILAMISYMLRRRDKEIDVLGSDVRSMKETQTGQAVTMTQLAVRVESVEEIKSDIKEIRAALGPMSISIAKIEQKLEDA